MPKRKTYTDAWLRANRFDGLCLPGGDPCGCQLDDLRPCGEVGDLCVPGVLGEDGLMYASKEAAEARRGES